MVGGSLGCVDVGVMMEVLIKVVVSRKFYICVLL